MAFNTVGPRGRALFRELQRDPSLLALWPLNETTGTIYDRCRATGAHSAASVGTPLYSQTGISGFQGIRFRNLPAAQFTAASTEYLSIADNSSLSVEAQDFSFSCWVYSDSFGTDRMVAAKDSNSAGNREWHLIYSSSASRWVMRLQNSTTNLLTLVAIAAGAPATATWYHLTVTYTTATRAAALYVNAGTPATGTASGDITASGAPFTIGAFGNTGSPWNGRIAAAGFWKKVLSAAEVTTLYNGGVLLAYSDLSGSLLTSLESWWDLSEASGTRADTPGSNDLTDNNTVTSNPRPEHSISLGNVANLSFERTDTASMVSLVKPQTGALGTILSKWDSANARGWWWGITAAGKPSFILANGAGNMIQVDASSALTTNVAAMLGVTYDGSSTPAGVTLYQAGAAVAMTTVANTLTATTEHSSGVQVGYRANGQGLFGTLAHPAVFGAVKSAREMKTLAALAGML